MVDVWWCSASSSQELLDTNRLVNPDVDTGHSPNFLKFATHGGRKRVFGVDAIEQEQLGC